MASDFIRLVYTRLLCPGEFAVRLAEHLLGDAIACEVPLFRRGDGCVAQAGGAERSSDRAFVEAGLYAERKVGLEQPAGGHRSFLW